MAQRIARPPTHPLYRNARGKKDFDKPGSL